ncbi:MAG: hypothetical protein IBJ18_02705 [Phycisphaerales bacterium]|nr:hypothetical protein [Phycisphaerales bacterium]
MWSTFVIVGLVVVLVSAAVRLAFYVWWRNRFGGRPVRFGRSRAARAARTDDAVTIRWEETPPR